MTGAGRSVTARRLGASAGAVTACVLLAAAPAQAGWIADLDAAIVHDDNLTNAYEVFDVVGDGAVTASGSAGYRFQLDGYSSLTVRALADGEKYFDVTGLDNVFLGIEAAWRRKLGLGYGAPWIGLAASTGHFSFDEDARDGWLHRVGLSGGKRIGQRLDLWLEVAYERRTMDHIRPVFPGFSGAVFNLGDTIVNLNASYTLTEWLSLEGGYEFRRGDVVSTLLVFQPGESIYEVTTAVAADPAFGPTAFSYRLKGTAHTVGARLRAGIADAFSAALEYRRVMTRARGDNNYTKNIFQLTLSYGF
jgi:hypothetical protein